MLGKSPLAAHCCRFRSVLYESSTMRSLRDRAGRVALLAFIMFGLWEVTPGQTPSPSPTPPSSDIFIVNVRSAQGKMKFGQPVKITTWVGYNNQPSFLPDGQAILYTSIREQQADIYRYDIRSAPSTHITN